MPDKQHHLYLIGLSLVLAFGHWGLFAEVEAPRKDALRYADYIYNLAAHDTFGLSYGAVNTAPEPGATNLPLYPWLTSQFAGQQTQQNLACVLTSAPRYDCYSPGESCGIVSSSAASCDNDFGNLVAFNYVLVALTLYLTGLLSFQIKNSGFVLLVTPVFAFLAFDLTEYAQRLLVINLVTPLFTALLLGLSQHRLNPSTATSFCCGGLTGLLCLTRPEFLLIIPLVALLLFFPKKQTSPARWRHSFTGVIAAFILLTPWIGRNYIQLNSAAVTSSQYGSYVLQERLSLNQMSWAQWLVSFVYWLPDSGDKLAKQLFPDHLAGAFDLRSAHSVFLTPAQYDKGLSSSELIHNEVLKEPVKHAAVTLALLWRGSFIGKYWGVIALIGFVLLLRKEIQQGRYHLLWLLALPLYLMLLRASISLNVPRYNVPMIALLALGWTHLVSFSRHHD